MILMTVCFRAAQLHHVVVWWLVQRLQQQRFIYSPHAARSSLTKRVATLAFSFNLPAVNPVNKALCARTRMTSPGQPKAYDLHGAPPTRLIFPSGVTARSPLQERPDPGRAEVSSAAVSPRARSLNHAGFYRQTQHRKLLITADNTEHTHTDTRTLKFHYF